MTRNLIMQAYGNGIALGISGNQSQINYVANFLYNWKATEGEAIFMSDNFAFVLSDEKRLLNAFFHATMNHYAKKLGNKFEGKKDGFKKLALLRAKNRFDEIERETFIPENETRNMELCPIGNDDFSSPPEKSQEVSNG